MKESSSNGTVMSTQEVKNKLLESKRFFDLYLLSRFLYRIGKPLISDQLYDQLELALKQNPELVKDSSYFERTYDDDLIPMEILTEFGLLSLIPQDLGADSEYSNYLDEDKTFSIKSVINYNEAYEFFMDNWLQDLIISLKTDGINGKNLYINNKLELSLSRARAGNGFNFTPRIVKRIPYTINSDFQEVKVFCESYVEQDYLQFLRNNYDLRGYKTEKSSALSLLRVNHSDADYRHLHCLAFGAEGLDETLSGTLNKLKSFGFETVPWIKIEARTVPKNFEEFVNWLKEVFDMFYENTKDIPSDGLVVKVDDLNYAGKVSGHYVNTELALKFEYWSFAYYKATVKEIVIEQRRVEACCKVKIVPMLTNDKCEARVVNVFNPSILIENKILPGTDVYFERNSGAVNILLYGKKLEDMLRGNGSCLSK